MFGLLAVIMYKKHPKHSIIENLIDTILEPYNSEKKFCHKSLWKTLPLERNDHLVKLLIGEKFYS